MIIKSNLKHLSKNIYDNLQKINYTDFEYKISKDKFKVPLINNSLLHSTYYPLNEGNKLNFPDDEKSLCVAIGFGAGYHLVNYYNKNKEILVLPLDLNLLNNVLSNIDLSVFFNDNRLKFISINEISQYIDPYKYSNYFLIIHPVMQRLYNNEVLSIINHLKKYLNPIFLENNTQRNLGFLWHKNILKNIKYFFENKFDFSDLYINKPIMIIGAGPSLEQNIKNIRIYKNKFYIASTDTAIKVLLKNGIEPDSVFTFDTQNYSYLHFTDNNKTRLFSDFTSPIRIPGLKQTMLFSNHPFSNIFINSGFSPIYLPSDSRNIGGAIIDFFKKYFLNIPVISVGIDFSYYRYNSYSNGTYISEYKSINSNFFKTIDKIDAELFYKYQFIKNNNDWKISNLLSDYLNTTNNLIFTISDSPYINFNKMNLIEFIDKYPVNEDQTLSFIKPKIKPKDFILNIRNFLDNDISPLYSYLLSINKKPSKIVINDILNNIEQYFSDIL